ncbi:MAG: FAD-dependent oxidoreductase [Oscillospiraceae bacterium]|nr:FAD-dependent oxidoreductase [Oscillospiraceae bacterium]
MEVRQNLIELCTKINGGHYTITPDCAEYKVFEQWITDEQISVMLGLTDMKPALVPLIAHKAKLSVSRTKEVLHELTDIGLVVQVVAPVLGMEVYLLPPYTPGIFEFLLINEKFCLAHPEIPYAFHQHATTSQIEHAPNTPMGAGIMRVISVESAIPEGTEQIDNERVSKYIEDNEGHLSITPCQCRRVRRMMGEGSGDLDEGLCIFMGHVADMFNRTGKGRPATVDEAKALVQKCDERGCVHQITTLHRGETFAICNCMPESCLALGVTQYYNTPGTSRSNYVAEIDQEKCVACGQCTDRCANNAIQMGQKLCAKTPVEHPHMELPDDLEWTPDRWNPEHRTNREYIAPEGTAPCKTACPAHIAVQGYLKLAAQGKYREALELIKLENPLPAVCGRICNRRCEDECTRGSLDRAVAIDEVKKFIADRELDRDMRFVPKKLYDYSDKKIAVIGAGPAGLSCAYYLAADNYRVTVFEKNELPGGMLRYGIPNYRLEKPVLDAEIDVLKQLGVIFRCGVEVGKDVSIQELREQGFDAFYLAVGAQKSAALGIPGEELRGVRGGIDFLREVNAGARPELGKKVVVIGGGNVAMDVARTAVRLGAAVTVAYRRKESDMPADPEEVAEAKAEGVKFLFEHRPVEIEGKNGKVTALLCEDGKKVACSTVLAAIGQRVDLGGLDLGELQTDQKGLVKADGFTYQTAQEDIFVGGDAFTGPKFAIDAIAQGKQGAISIHRFVHPGQSLVIGRDRLSYHAFDKDNVDFDTVRRESDPAARQIPEKDSAKAVSFRDDRKTFTEEQVKKETARCLGCGASFVDPNKCLGCGVCTTRCRFDAIHLRKRSYVESIDYFERPKVLPEFIAERENKIRIRKMNEKGNNAAP